MIVFFTKSTSAGQFEVLLAPFSVASRNNYLLGIFPVALSVAAHPLRHGLQRVRLMGGFATLLSSASCPRTEADELAALWMD